VFRRVIPNNRRIEVSLTPPMEHVDQLAHVKIKNFCDVGHNRCHLVAALAQVVELVDRIVQNGRPASRPCDQDRIGTSQAQEFIIGRFTNRGGHMK